MPDYHFISVKHHHRDFFCGMIAEPHVAEWWGDPDHEWDLIVEGEETGASRGFIVHLSNEPIGYVQDWIPLWSQDYLKEEPWQKLYHEEDRGIDISLASAGLGHGSAIIRAFVDKLFDEGIPRVTIDPDVRNQRAFNAYEKAGFRVFDDSYTKSHGVLLMEITPDMFNADQ